MVCLFGPCILLNKILVYKKAKPQPSRIMLDCGFSYSLILDYNFSIFLFTNSLKSLPFSRFFESSARS